MKLVLLAEAEAELEDAAVWYDERSPGLGDELLDDIQRGLQMIRETPETWPRWPSTPARIPPIRRFVLERFPYAVAYQVHPDFIAVLAIAHVKRRPLYWIGRGT